MSTLAAEPILRYEEDGTPTQAELDRRVQSGISLLDHEGPDGWRSKINLNDLNIDSLVACILAQVYGDYKKGKTALGLDSKSATLFGFAIFEDFFFNPVNPSIARRKPTAYINQVCELLTNTWKAALA